jgi:hypothetical protein
VWKVHCQIPDGYPYKSPSIGVFYARTSRHTHACCRTREHTPSLRFLSALTCTPFSYHHLKVEYLCRILVLWSSHLSLSHSHHNMSRFVCYVQCV